MGTAAYNRGTKAIREQIDRELADKKPALYEPYYLERDVKPLRDRIKELEANLTSAKRALASSRAMLAVERDNRAEERTLQDARVKEHWALAERYRHSWEKASAMIRACLTPEQVDQYRQERDSKGGDSVRPEE